MCGQPVGAAIISAVGTPVKATTDAAGLYSANLPTGSYTVTVTSQVSPGDDPDNPVLQTFHMFDFIGGRYSVTSAVGGVPLSLSAVGVPSFGNVKDSMSWMSL